MQPPHQPGRSRSWGRASLVLQFPFRIPHLARFATTGAGAASGSVAQSRRAVPDARKGTAPVPVYPGWCIIERLVRAYTWIRISNQANPSA